jgi:hypothetical protein
MMACTLGYLLRMFSVLFLVILVVLIGINARLAAGPNGHHEVFAIRVAGHNQALVYLSDQLLDVVLGQAFTNAQRRIGARATSSPLSDSTE